MMLKKYKSEGLEILTLTIFIQSARAIVEYENTTNQNKQKIAYLYQDFKLSLKFLRKFNKLAGIYVDAFKIERLRGCINRILNKIHNEKRRFSI